MPTATPPLLVLVAGKPGAGKTTLARRLSETDALGLHVLTRDWGCAHLADPALDFVGMPLAAAAQALAGHREVAPLDGDATAEARVLWLHLSVALELLPRGAAPGCSWGERPLAMLLDVLRFFFAAPPAPWRALAP